MKHVTNFPVFDGCLKDYGSMAEVGRDCERLGLDGLEIIWDHAPYTGEMPPQSLVVGYHMMFWSYWVDFYRGKREAVMAEFGDWDIACSYFHGQSGDDMVAYFKTDLQRAIDLQAEYVVFHVSDVSLAEAFTYRFAHTDQEVIDASAELINRVLDGSGAQMAFLVENQWWPGLRFTDPALTARMLDGIDYANKGIMLDTGHLLHTNTALRTQQQAADYLQQCYDAHGALGKQVRGLHLQQSLSGAYVEGAGFALPDDFAGGYWDKYTRTYQHIVQIDRHEPWTDPAIAAVVGCMQPEWINHELSAWPRDAHNQAVASQLAVLGRKAPGRL